MILTNVFLSFWDGLYIKKIYTNLYLIWKCKTKSRDWTNKTRKSEDQMEKKEKKTNWYEKLTKKGETKNSLSQLNILSRNDENNLTSSAFLKSLFDIQNSE